MQCGRGRTENPSSEIRDVHGAGHTQEKGCREIPEPLAMEWGRGLGLELSPFPEAVYWGGPGRAKFPPMRWPLFLGAPKEKLQGMGGGRNCRDIGGA